MKLDPGPREHLVSALLKPINPSVIIILGIYTIVWGLWIVSPFWNVFETGLLYSMFASLAPEAFWGSFAILCGTMTTYGAIKRSYRALVRGAAAAFWHWLMISTIYFVGDPAATGGITALFLAIYAAFIFLNLRTNFKDRKDSHDLLS